MLLQLRPGVPQVMPSEDRREFVALEGQRHFARACPIHGSVLIEDGSTLTCQRGHGIGEDDEADTPDGRNASRLWNVVEVVGGVPTRTVAYVFYGWSVVWAEWFTDTYPDAKRYNGRLLSGLTEEQVHSLVPGVKRIAYRLRRNGLSPEKAMARALRLQVRSQREAVARHNAAQPA